MWTFGSNTIMANETTAVYPKIGLVKMLGEEFLPYYRFYLNGKSLLPD